MTPDNPFLQALLANPDDDTLRLALADWLDENVQPERAEFIRIQIELARGVSDQRRRWHLEARQRDLLVAHDAEWVAPRARVLECKPGQWGGWDSGVGLWNPPPSRRSNSWSTAPASLRSAS